VECGARSHGNTISAVNHSEDDRVIAGFGREWEAFTHADVAGEEDLRRSFDAYFRVFPWDEISRSATGFDLRGLLLDYPAALMVSFQPVVLPGMAGVVALWKRRREGLLVLLPLWAGLPVLLYALSSARSPRYIFPIFPALALCAGEWLTRRWPALGAALPRVAVPLVSAAVAALLWVHPSLLTRAGTTVFKTDRLVKERVPEGEPLTYLGSRGQYWGLANPLLYYDERFLESPADSATEALARLRTRRSGLLVVERRRLAELGPATPGSRVLLDGGGFLVLDVGGTTAEVEVDRPGPPH